jgi:hypothetical protein
MNGRGWAVAATLALAVACMIVSQGCATLGNRTKTLLLMGGAGVAAGVAGAALAPAGEHAGMHGLLWGGVAAAGAGGAGLFLFDEEKRRVEAETRAAKLERELKAFSDEVDPEMVASQVIGLEKPLPPRLRGLITPGQWSLYKVDRWSPAGDSELVHQDMILRFNQPQLNPSGRLSGNSTENKSEGEK